MNDKQRRAMFAKNGRSPVKARPRPAASPEAAARRRRRQNREVDMERLHRHLSRIKGIDADRAVPERARERHEDPYYSERLVTDAAINGPSDRSKFPRQRVVQAVLASRARPRGEGPFASVDDVEKMNQAAGQHFFDADTMRGFKTRVLGDLHGGRYFVTSEPDFYGRDRRYTVRRANDDATIDTVGDFREYKTAYQAQKAAREAAEGLA